MAAIVDGYAHIGLPRFQSVETCLAVMDANGIDAAMVCPFEACPDLHEVHRARMVAPDRFRIFGLALGRERSEIEAGLHAQFDAGFEGFRLGLERISEAPFILDVIAERKGISLVVGANGLADGAARLVAFLDANPDCIVVAPHMAGPTSPDIFARNGAVRALFHHPNFHVVMSRHTLFEPAVMTVWGQALIEHCGWSRLMWGSEAPPLFWRDESLSDALDWILTFRPGESDLAAFQGGNARRTVFARPARPVGKLVLPYAPFDHELKRPAPMWPAGFPADTRVPAKLLAAWLADGGPGKQSLSGYTNALLLKALE